MPPRRVPPDHDRMVILKVQSWARSETHRRLSVATLRILYEEPDLAKRGQLLFSRSVDVRGPWRKGNLDWDGYVDIGADALASWAELLDTLVEGDVLDPAVDWVSRAVDACLAAQVLSA